MPITHATCSALTDLGVAGEIGPDEWNTCHILDGGNEGEVPVRDPAASGGFTWRVMAKPQPIWTLTPLNAEYGACSNFPQLQKIEGTQSGLPYYVLDYDAATSKSAYWSRMMVPTGFTVSRAALTLSVLSVASSDGTVGWLVNSQAVTCGGKWDVAFTTTDIFTAVNPATCEGVLKQYRTTFITNSTAWKEDSLIQVRIRRDLADTLGSDARFLSATLSLSSST